MGRMTHWLLQVLALLVLHNTWKVSGDGDWKQLKDLKGAMYAEMKYSRACVKLLTNSGPQGCEAADEELITAPLVNKKDLASLPKGRRVVVVPTQEADAFLLQLLSDPELRSQVAGVLLDPTSGRPTSQSVATTFPGAAYAPYNAPDYIWNPYGTGLSHAWFGLPIYMLTEGLAAEAAWRAAYNAEHDLKGGRHVARLELPMQAQGDSAACISQQTCLPVGSYGVWTAVPPLPDPFYVNATARPITLLLAQMDGNGLIHDLARAAGTAVSGLVSCLAALTLLQAANVTDTYARQLAFVALPGEGFEYIGSRRLLYEMALNSSFVRGLNLDLIDQVVEVGQVGGAWSPATNTTSFFLHSQRSGGYGNASTLLQAAQAAAAAASAAEEASKIQVQPASASTPGLPPSSLMSLLRLKPSLAGAVLADFDTAFRNPFYQSEWDDAGNGNVTLQSITDASLLLAHTLHSLLAGPTTPPALPAPAANRTTAAALVADLAACLLADEPGMRCPLATALMTPDISVSYDGSTSAAITGYPGVLSWLSSDPKSSSSKPNLPRFLFNYLGAVTAAPLPANASPSTSSPTEEGAACDPAYSGCHYPLACIGWRYGTQDPAGMGRCRNTTASYVPAYSTKMTYSSRRWWVDNSSAAWEANYSWPPDPMWTESNWPAFTPTLRVYQEEARATQVITLVVGLLLTAATGAVSWVGVRAFEKHLKSQ